jgi:HD-GYP domain-containing protein (c-di-GMP phosphodiesterase class II)
VKRKPDALARARARARALGARLRVVEERLESLNRIGIALSAERDVDALLSKILTEARRFSGSEAGSLYLLEEHPDGPRLRFKLAQNDAVPISFAERTVGADETSLAGWVAVHGVSLVLADAYALPEDAPFRHNDAFDRATGYRTRAVLVVPMKDHRGELVGVLQLMNRKRAANGAAEPYPEDLVPLVLSLATQAAVCLKANRLTASIRRLFEDFAQAAIFAVEQRDPTTAGHSHRVAELTDALARLVDRSSDGPYADVAYTKEELHEIRTAALLHDFGKIAVPERVLVKAKKLEEDEILRIRDRFDFVLEAAEAEAMRALLRRLAANGGTVSGDDLAALERGARERAAELEEAFDAIRHANEPTILPDQRTARLKALLTQTWRDRRGRSATLLLPEEFRFLAIPQGSLSPEERLSIEGHVTQTWRFLSSIPWTPDLARVPDIAYGHHEKLDGSGYPRRIDEAQIPVATRALTVCDVYDALTASDRPYKKAVALEAALSILEGEARRGHLDPWLVNAFVTEKIWAAIGP